jgi:O-methyltransferase involved in polyketide biosynthesis
MQAMHTVSETALLTLKSRVVESGKANPVLDDPLGEVCFGKLLEILPADVRDRIMTCKLSSFLTLHLALRARKYDELCREFLEAHPRGLVANLGCGFDTRFWRLGIDKDQYLELDLPHVMELKQEILGERMDYTCIKGSVLDTDWIGQLQSIQSKDILFLAEGLFMYFDPRQSIQALQNIADTFEHSRLVVEVVHEKYTKGRYKKMVEKKMRRRAGSSAGEYFLFGIKRSSDLETYHPDYRVSAEWSCFEERDIRPGFLRLFRNSRLIAKSQYTVIADIV